MYINITATEVSTNKSSSATLVSYLEKENNIYNKDVPEYWFNGTGVNFEPYEVRHSIDNNIAKLSKADAKFFLVNISPSQKELRFLSERYGREEMKAMLKIYAGQVMDAYARNFKRAGIESAGDLLWFAKLENFRYYGFKDKEVLEGLRKRGERKDGDQLHIQVIVSRKDITNRIKLSPMNTSRGRNGAHSEKLGQFNRLAFKHSGESIFDSLFSFDRRLDESLGYSNVLKNGNIERRGQLDMVRALMSGKGAKDVALGFVRDLSLGSFISAAGILEGTGKMSAAFITDMMQQPVDVQPVRNPIEKELIKRRRRQVQQDQGQGL